MPNTMVWEGGGGVNDHWEKRKNEDLEGKNEKGERNKGENCIKKALKTDPAWMWMWTALKSQGAMTYCKYAYYSTYVVTNAGDIFYALSCVQLINHRGWIEHWTI